MLNADYILRMYKKFMHVRRVNVTELSASEIMNSIDQMQLPLCLKPVCDCLKWINSVVFLQYLLESGVV